MPADAGSTLFQPWKQVSPGHGEGAETPILARTKAIGRARIWVWPTRPVVRRGSTIDYALLRLVVPRRSTRSYRRPCHRTWMVNQHFLTADGWELPRRWCSRWTPQSALACQETSTVGAGGISSRARLGRRWRSPLRAGDVRVGGAPADYDCGRRTRAADACHVTPNMGVVSPGTAGALSPSPPVAPPGTTGADQTGRNGLEPRRGHIWKSGLVPYSKTDRSAFQTPSTFHGRWLRTVSYPWNPLSVRAPHLREARSPSARLPLNRFEPLPPAHDS